VVTELLVIAQTASPSASPASPVPDGRGPLGTGLGVLIAIVLLGLLLWSRRRLDDD
jgi:hypothetical protein